MPGVRINLPVELEPAALPAAVPDHVKTAGEAMPGPAAADDPPGALEGKAQEPIVPSKGKARK